MEWMMCNECNWEGTEEQRVEETQCPECFSEDLEEMDITEELSHRAPTIILPSEEEAFCNKIAAIMAGDLSPATKTRMIITETNKLPC